MPEPRRVDLLVRNAYVVTLDADRRVFVDGALAVRDGRIVEVGHLAGQPIEAAETIDAGGAILMPGFVNAHNHLLQAGFRGYNDERWPVLDIPAAVRTLLAQLFRFAGRLDAERAAKLVRLHALELTRSGYVATHDEHFTNVGTGAADGAWQAIEESGLRGFLARCILATDMIPPEGREDVEAGLLEVERLHRRFTSDRIEVAPGILNFSFLDDPEDMRRIGEGARRLGLRLDIDMTDNSRGARLRARGFEDGQVAYYDRFDLLAEPLYAGKGVHLTSDEFAHLGRTDGRLGLVPMLRFFDAAGLPIHHALACGMLPGLGTDAPLVSDCQSPFEMMRMAILAQNLAIKREAAAGQPVPEHAHWMTAERAIEMATLGGARTLFMDDVSGSLEIGKSADFVVIRLDDATVAAGWERRRDIGALVWGGGTHLVDRVYVAGRCLLAAGRSRIWDENIVVREAMDVLDAIGRETGLDAELPPRRPGGRFRGWNYH